MSSSGGNVCNLEEPHSEELYTEIEEPELKACKCTRAQICDALGDQEKASAPLELVIGDWMPTPGTEN